MPCATITVEGSSDNSGEQDQNQPQPPDQPPDQNQPAPDPPDLPGPSESGIDTRTIALGVAAVGAGYFLTQRNKDNNASN